MKREILIKKKELGAQDLAWAVGYINIYDGIILLDGQAGVFSGKRYSIVGERL